MLSVFAGHFQVGFSVALFLTELMSCYSTLLSYMLPLYLGIGYLDVFLAVNRCPCISGGVESELMVMFCLFSSQSHLSFWFMRRQWVEKLCVGVVVNPCAVKTVFYL